MCGYGYPNTFIPFRRTIQREWEAGESETALRRLQAVNCYQWLNRIDAFLVAEGMWSDPAYTADEIVEEWLGITSVQHA